MIIDEHTDLETAWKEAKEITLWQLATLYIQGKNRTERKEIWNSFGILKFCCIASEMRTRLRFGDPCQFCLVSEWCEDLHDKNKWIHRTFSKQWVELHFKLLELTELDLESEN